jgi:ketosteroid isomerase-like protein
MDNKSTVAHYMDGFNKTDHAQILSCLTDDVEWIAPGFFHHKGKDAFDKEIENDAFVGKPVITVTRMIEENNVVVAEGSVLATTKEGATLKILFCDLFEMQNTKIKRLISYLIIPQP